jgi:hypothetical protein
MDKFKNSNWKNLTCSAFHKLAPIFAIGLGIEKKVAM